MDPPPASGAPPGGADLAVDREARPVHVDPRLDDATYARAKIADIIGRVLEPALVPEH